MKLKDFFDWLDKRREKKCQKKHRIYWMKVGMEVTHEEYHIISYCVVCEQMREIVFYWCPGCEGYCGIPHVHKAEDNFERQNSKALGPNWTRFDLDRVKPNDKVKRGPGYIWEDRRED